MEINDAITAIDGRNRQKLLSLIPYFSESALNKYRVLIELAYLTQLAERKIIPTLSRKELTSIKCLIEAFGDKDHKQIKKIEETTNHDVKAVEYYLQGKFKKNGLEKFIPYLHIGLTSEDTNNLAYSKILLDFRQDVLLPRLTELLMQIKSIAVANADIALLGRTHGQPAVPTTVGKELINYFYRLQKQLAKLTAFSFEGKCNGAVGNFNALHFTYPQVDWIRFSRDFVSSLGLVPNLHTIQILHYDNWLEFFQIIDLINGILTDFSINMWQYIMLETFIQKKKAGEVGSSTMPQKVNPINFEHAEGSLQMANSYIDYFQRKLIVTRLQRDLSDSTVRRSFGNAMAYTILGWESIANGLKKVAVNKEHIAAELNNHWEVLAEAIQVYLRSRNDDQAYEKLKELTRGKKITQELYRQMLVQLGLDKEAKFTNLCPGEYTGLAKKLAK